MDPFEASVTASSLVEATARARAVRDRRSHLLEEQIQPRIDGHLAAYQIVVDDLKAVHAAIADQTDLDLGAHTRLTAVWEMSGRAISLADGLIDQLRRGYGPQTVGTARLMHESAVLLEAFTIAPEQLVRRWLEEGHVPQKDARAELEKLAIEGALIAAESGTRIESDPRFKAIVASLVAEGLPEDADPAAAVAFIAREEYKEFSHKRGGHNDRPGLTYARDADLRRFVYGSHPDPLARAYFVEEAGHDIERVVIVVGYAFARFLFGPAYQQDRIGRLREGLEAVRRELPLDDVARDCLAAATEHLA
jgi:hypothetical protein